MSWVSHPTEAPGDAPADIAHANHADGAFRHHATDVRHHPLTALDRVPLRWQLLEQRGGEHHDRFRDTVKVLRHRAVANDDPRSVAASTSICSVPMTGLQPIFRRVQASSTSREY